MPEVRIICTWISILFHLLYLWDFNRLLKLNIIYKEIKLQAQHPHSHFIRTSILIPHLLILNQRSLFKCFYSFIVRSILYMLLFYTLTNNWKECWVYQKVINTNILRKGKYYRINNVYLTHRKFNLQQISQLCHFYVCRNLIKYLILNIDTS